MSAVARVQTYFRARIDAAQRDRGAVLAVIGITLVLILTSGAIAVDLTAEDGPQRAVDAARRAFGEVDIVVANAGPSLATSTLISDTFPAEVTGISWNCTDNGMATCPNAMDSGDISETVDLPAGGQLTYVANGTVSAGYTLAINVEKQGGGGSITTTLSPSLTVIG